MFWVYILEVVGLHLVCETRFPKLDIS
jgi:hypothetical protein